MAIQVVATWGVKLAFVSKMISAAQLPGIWVVSALRERCVWKHAIAKRHLRSIAVLRHMGIQDVVIPRVKNVFARVIRHAVLCCGMQVV